MKEVKSIKLAYHNGLINLELVLISYELLKVKCLDNHILEFEVELHLN